MAAPEAGGAQVGEQDPHFPEASLELAGLADVLLDDGSIAIKTRSDSLARLTSWSGRCAGSPTA